MNRKILQPQLDSARRVVYSLSTLLVVALLAVMVSIGTYFAEDGATPILTIVSRTTLILTGITLVPIAIALFFLIEFTLSKSRKNLESLYIGTRWISPEGHTGTVQAVSDFGGSLDLAFPDGRAGESDIQILRPAGYNPDLLPENHIASIPSKIALEQLSAKDSTLFKTAIVLMLVLIATFIGASALITGQEFADRLLKSLCVMVPVVALLVVCIKALIVRELHTQTMIRNFSDADWIAPDGRVGKFGSFSQKANEVTLVMEDRTLRHFNPNEIVQA